MAVSSTYLLWFLSFSICLNGVLSNTCGSPELAKCKCGEGVYDEKDYYIVNCTNTGFKNTDMLAQLPEQTQVLIFTGNYLPNLPWNIFGDIDENRVKKLRIIDMTNNHINEIKGKTYHHVQFVERLILNHNNLTINDDDVSDVHHHHPRIFSNFENLEELHLTNAFADNTGAALSNDLHDIFYRSNLTKLQKLHLEQNEIDSFKDVNVFCDLKSLKDLYLGQNSIASLNFNLSCLEKLRFVDLEYNKIKKLNENDLKTFDMMTWPYRNQQFLIELNNNPLDCDFSVNDLVPWISGTNVTVRNKDYLICIRMRHGINYTINVLQYVQTTKDKVSGVITILIVILSLILLTLSAAYVYLSKGKFKTKIDPLMEIVGRKVHYTRIESQNV